MRRAILMFLTLTSGVIGIGIPASSASVNDSVGDRTVNDPVDDAVDDAVDSTVDNETVDDETVDDNVEYTQEIDRQTRIIDWVYDTERKGFSITFEADTRTVLTLTEAVQYSEGAGSGSIFEQRLPAGTSEVFVPVEPRAGEAALTITTPASIQNNRYVYVSTGQTTTGGPWSTTGSEAGWFGGLSVALSMMVAAAWNVRRRSDDEPEQLT